MQIAILVVLILILASISPWVIALAAAIAVAYGIWVVVAAVLFVLMAIFCAWFHAFRERKPMISRETERTIELVNEEFRRRAAEEASCAVSKPKDPAQANPRRLIICRSCSAEIEKYSMFCPVCGKKPI